MYFICAVGFPLHLKYILLSLLFENSFSRIRIVHKSLNPKSFARIRVTFLSDCIVFCICEAGKFNDIAFGLSHTVFTGREVFLSRVTAPSPAQNVTATEWAEASWSPKAAMAHVATAPAAAAAVF